MKTHSNSIPRQALTADNELPQTTEGTFTDGLLSLNADQWATAEELSRLDPQLAGLYRLGFSLLSRVEEPGVAYLIAHAGREINRGVVNLLTGTEVGLKIVTEDIPDNERNRGSIGTILQLPPDHPLVTKWFQVNSTFVRSVHFQRPDPSADNVRAAFLQLSELLFGRLAPYFATHAQLDMFLRIEMPDAETVDRVRPMLARPTQRHYFFSNLAHSGWLSPLAATGQFANFPELLDLGEGKFQTQPWPEGEYLKRMATVEPEQVTDILLKLPKTLKNPFIWDAVVQSAAVLPASLADQLTDHVENALKTAPLLWFPMHMASLVRNLASSKCEGAFRLAACLLWLNSPPKEEGNQADKIVRNAGDTEWVLARIDSYTLGELLKEAFPILEEFDSEKTIELLSRTLDRAVWLIEKTEGVKSSYLRGHNSWSLRLEDIERDDDVRAQLAIALTGAATRVASQSPEQAAKALAVLKKHKHEIFKRITIVVLTHVGSLAQEQLDEIISDPEMLDSPSSAREYAALLRSQFNNASPRAQRLFLYNLKRGPAPDRVSNMLSWRELEPTEEAVQQVVSDWQSRRLMWFHDHLPELLRPIAEQIGVEAKKPSEHDRALNEEGSYSGGVSWVGESSPISADEISEMTPQGLISYLETWRPDAERTIGGPSFEGLEKELSRFTADRPDIAANVVNRLMASSTGPGYAAALLKGFREAIDKGNAVPWDEALDLTSFVVGRADYIERESNDSDLARRWRWAASEAAELMEKGCSGNLIPASKSDRVWSVLDKAFRSAATWSATNTSEDFSTFYSVLSAALNSVSGKFVDALIDAALWEYRRHHSENREDVEESSVAAPRLIPLVEEVLSHGGRAGIAAQAMLGHYVPQLLLMARAWTLGLAQTLFDGGATSPTTMPIWGAYITRSQLYDNVFRDLRPWYVIAADAAKEPSSDQDRDWSLSRHLVLHVLVAVIRGLATIGDEDCLVERTFSNVKVEDRTHAYWAIFRGWTDSESPVDEEFVGHLVRFWEWRLDQLEVLSDESERSEEASGLSWLLAAPYVPVAEAARLGLRTVSLAGGSLVTRGATLWERLTQLAETETAGAYEITERLVNKTLSNDYPHLPYRDVAPVLRLALNSNSKDIEERATRLIHTLGDRGMFEYGELLRPVNEQTENQEQSGRNI